MQNITLLQVPRLTVGSGCLADCHKYLIDRKVQRVLVIAPRFARKW